MIDAAMLSAELTKLGLHFVIGEVEPRIPTNLAPEELIAGLVQQSDARLRLALIALFLYRPDFETAVSPALASLPETEQMQLKIYYTASVQLQRIHQDQLQQLVPLWHSLPDYFSDMLGLHESNEPIVQLKKLGRYHHKISGIAANWSGTYQHAANRLITRLEKEASWAI